jgi:hypothetical protein
MALRTGTGGFIQMNDTSGASLTGTPAAGKMTITRWSLDIPRDEGDTTGFQATKNLRTVVGGNAETSGSFEGFLDDTNKFVATTMEDPEAAAANIVLQYNRTAPTGETVAQHCIISGWLEGVAVGCRPGEPNSVSGSFFGTDAPAWAKGNPEDLA